MDGFDKKFHKNLCFGGIGFFFSFPGMQLLQLVQSFPEISSLSANRVLISVQHLTGIIRLGCGHQGLQRLWAARIKRFRFPVRQVSSFLPRISGHNIPVPGTTSNSSGKVNGTAFIVVDPKIDITVEDFTLGFDARISGYLLEMKFSSVSIPICTR